MCHYPDIKRSLKKINMIGIKCLQILDLAWSGKAMAICPINWARWKLIRKPNRHWTTLWISRQPNRILMNFWSIIITWIWRAWTTSLLKGLIRINKWWAWFKAKVRGKAVSNPQTSRMYHSLAAVVEQVHLWARLKPIYKTKFKEARILLLLCILKLKRISVPKTTFYSQITKCLAAIALQMASKGTALWKQRNKTIVQQDTDQG